MKNSNTTTQKTVNPFELLATSPVADKGGRKLSHTNQLVQVSKERATETIKLASENSALHSLANKMMAGDPADLMELFQQTQVIGYVEADSQFLADADEAELKQLLESRRSDRSKLKKKGISSSMMTCHGYVAAMYAELLVRQAMGKPYTGSRGAESKEVDTSDLDAINRKIKSLQSKLCRFKQMEATEENLKTIEEVKSEIARLQAFRPARAKVAVKSIKADDLRAALATLNMEDLPQEILDLMAKLA